MFRRCDGRQTVLQTPAGSALLRVDADHTSEPTRQDRPLATQACRFVTRQTRDPQTHVGRRRSDCHAPSQ